LHERAQPIGERGDDHIGSVLDQSVQQIAQIIWGEVGDERARQSAHCVGRHVAGWGRLVSMAQSYIHTTGETSVVATLMRSERMSVGLEHPRRRERDVCGRQDADADRCATTTAEWRSTCNAPNG
jgi:hypothetical protein